MKEFLEALRTILIGDNLRFLIIIMPVITGIWVWAAFRWAYGERLKTVYTSLAELRSSFDRKVQLEVEKVNEQHTRELQALRSKLETEKAKLESETANREELFSDFWVFSQKAERLLASEKLTELRLLISRAGLKLFDKRYGSIGNLSDISDEEILRAWDEKHLKRRDSET